MSLITSGFEAEGGRGGGGGERKGKYVLEAMQ